MRPGTAGVPPAEATQETARRARTSVWRTIEAGAGDYRRERHLPRLLPLMPREIADESTGARRRIVARLARALRGPSEPAAGPGTGRTI